jgi:hypothetical protein
LFEAFLCNICAFEIYICRSQRLSNSGEFFCWHLTDSIGIKCSCTQRKKERKTLGFYEREEKGDGLYGMFQHSAAGKREKKKKAEVGHVSSRPAAQKQKGSCMRSDTACQGSLTSIKAKKLLNKKEKKFYFRK